MGTTLYLIGSLRNPILTELAEALRGEGLSVFDDWYAAGPEADDYWQQYEQYRGRSYQQALEGYAANHVFSFDLRHLDFCDAALLVCPAGRSAHLELGYVIGSKKPGYVLLNGEPERWDVMYRFATKVFINRDEAIKELKECLIPSMTASGSPLQQGSVLQPEEKNLHGFPITCV
jgi:hypothetical protein